MLDQSPRQLTVMAFDGARLAVPLHQVTTIERTAQIQPGLAPGQAVGSIRARGQNYAVYALSRRLTILPALPVQRAFCVCLNAGEGQPWISVACDTVTSLNLDITAVMQPLPVCMQQSGGPVQGLCRHAQQFLLTSTADALITYLTGKESK